MDPFQRYLGLPSGNRSLTLFQLIGVTDGETDPGVLKAAFQKVALQLKQADRSLDPDGWKTVVERVKKAQAVLLSPEANSQYFAELKARATAPTRRPTTTTPNAQTDSLADLMPLLPPGDPAAALDISMLESATAVATAPWFAPSEIRMQSLAKELSGVGISQLSPNSAGFVTSSANVSKSSLKKPIRPKSSPLSRAMPLILLFAGAFGVLGFGGYMLYSSNQNKQLAQANANNPAIPPQAPGPAKVDPVMGNLVPNAPTSNRPPRRGGLPELNAADTPVDPINELPPVPLKDEWNEDKNGKPEPAADNEKEPAENNMVEKPQEPSPQPMPETMKPENPSGNLGDLVNNDKPMDTPKPDENTPNEPMPETETKPTAAQIKQFSDSMNLARKQLVPRAFDKFAAAMEKAEANAISAKQKKQLTRLKVMGEAVKRYEDALLAAIAARSAGDNIQVKSTVVGWVEGNGNRFKVRVGGSTDSHTTTTAPLGLTNALVDLAISPDDATTKLSKACVALLSAKVAGRDEVNKWLEDATAAGLIDSDFRSVIDDKYDEAE